MSELNPNSGVDQSYQDDKTKTQRVLPSLKDNLPSPQGKNNTNSSLAGLSLNKDRSRSEINNMKSPISSGSS